MLRPFLAFALLLPLAACDATDDGESLLGQFGGAVTLDGATAELAGEAVYAILDTPDGPEFVLGLFVGGLYDAEHDDYEVLLLRREGGVPSVGAHAIQPAPERGSRAVGATYADVAERDDDEEAGFDDDAFGAFVRAETGVLAIDRVDPYGFVRGSFQFAGTGLRIEAPAQSVQGRADGRFEARRVPASAFRRPGIDFAR